MCVVPVSAPGPRPLVCDGRLRRPPSSSDHSSSEASASRISSTIEPPRDGGGVVSTDTPRSVALERRALANAVLRPGPTRAPGRAPPRPESPRREAVRAWPRAPPVATVAGSPYTRLPSSVRSRISCRIPCRNARGSSTADAPRRASSSAGSTSPAHSERREPAVRLLEPGTSPGTATEPSPTRNVCVPASSKSTTTSSISPSGCDGRREEAVEDDGLAARARGRGGSRLPWGP